MNLKTEVELLEEALEFSLKVLDWLLKYGYIQTFNDGKEEHCDHIKNLAQQALQEGKELI